MKAYLKKSFTDLVRFGLIMAVIAVICTSPILLEQSPMATAWLLTLWDIAVALWTLLRVGGTELGAYVSAYWSVFLALGGAAVLLWLEIDLVASALRRQPSEIDKPHS